jgi:hypothetical protein
MFEVKRSQRSKEPKNVFPGDEDGDAEEEVLGFDVFTDRAPQTWAGDSEAVVEDFGIVTAGLTSFAATQKEGETRKNPIFQGPASRSGSMELDRKVAWTGSSAPTAISDPTYLDIAVEPEPTASMMLAPGYRHYFPAETHHGKTDSLVSDSDSDAEIFTPLTSDFKMARPWSPGSSPISSPAGTPAASFKSSRPSSPLAAAPVAAAPPAKAAPPTKVLRSIEPSSESGEPLRVAPPKRKIFNL